MKNKLQCVAVILINVYNMPDQIKTLLFSLLTPGLGYLQIGNKKYFYMAISIFFTVIAVGIIFRLFTTFSGVACIAVILLVIYLFAAIHPVLKAKLVKPKPPTAGRLKFIFTLSFILITGLSFANRRTIMGFDLMSMGVSVMEPTVLTGDKFLINTWAYKWRSSPKRNDIIAHSFNGQQGLYLNRIIAIGTDKIEIKNGTVLLNGKILNEPYILSKNAKRPQSRDMRSTIIPEGYYFVMGDNRDASFGDSRFSGLITSRNIVGKITDVISSQNKSRIGTTLK